jgi:hypothetical protein
MKAHWLKGLVLASLAAVGCGDDVAPPDLGGQVVTTPAPDVATPVADDPTSLVPFDAYEMNPGAQLALARLNAKDGTKVKFVVLGSNLQPLAVGIGYVGPTTDPDPHHSYAWIQAGAYSPFADQTPAPLVAGEYVVEVACRNEATLPCIFGFKAWFTAGGDQ